MKMRREERRVSCIFSVLAVHESSSDPIMTEAALLPSPTANLRLHAFYMPSKHTQTATSRFMRTRLQYRYTYNRSD